MEELLNKLIEKGWKPFGMKCTFEYVDILCNQPYRFKHLNAGFWASLRELVSKESMLWQFVCENGIVNEKHRHERILDPIFWEWWADCKRQEHDWDYWYRLIESALCDEDKLEQFLLKNIKIEWQN